MDQLYPRRTIWLYVIKDVLMSLSGWYKYFLTRFVSRKNDMASSLFQKYVAGKTTHLYRHDLLALHNKQNHRFSMHMNKIPEKLVPRKFALTTKVPDTKGCSRCCVSRNPYNGYKYLCGAVPSGIFLMQWYDPLNKFMLLKVSLAAILRTYNLSSLYPSSSSNSIANCVCECVGRFPAFRVQSAVSAACFRNDNNA